VSATWGYYLMMTLRMTMQVVAAAALLHACGAEPPEPAPMPSPECGIPECFRAVQCVSECGGAVLSSGCCPCAEGTFDSISCPAETSDR
jgi:hypothetical protein